MGGSDAGQGDAAFFDGEAAAEGGGAPDGEGGFPGLGEGGVFPGGEVAGEDGVDEFPVLVAVVVEADAGGARPVAVDGEGGSLLSTEVFDGEGFRVAAGQGDAHVPVDVDGAVVDEVIVPSDVTFLGGLPDGEVAADDDGAGGGVDGLEFQPPGAQEGIEFDLSSGEVEGAVGEGEADGVGGFFGFGVVGQEFVLAVHDGELVEEVLAEFVVGAQDHDGVPGHGDGVGVRGSFPEVEDGGAGSFRGSGGTVAEDGVGDSESDVGGVEGDGSLSDAVDDVAGGEGGFLEGGGREAAQVDVAVLRGGVGADASGPVGGVGEAAPGDGDGVGSGQAVESERASGDGEEDAAQVGGVGHVEGDSAGAVGSSRETDGEVAVEGACQRAGAEAEGLPGDAFDGGIGEDVESGQGDGLGGVASEVEEGGGAGCVGGAEGEVDRVGEGGSGGVEGGVFEGQGRGVAGNVGRGDRSGQQDGASAGDAGLSVAFGREGDGSGQGVGGTFSSVGKDEARAAAQFQGRGERSGRADSEDGSGSDGNRAVAGGAGGAGFVGDAADHGAHRYFRIVGDAEGVGGADVDGAVGVSVGEGQRAGVIVVAGDVDRAGEIVESGDVGRAGEVLVEDEFPGSVLVEDDGGVGGEVGGKFSDGGRSPFGDGQVEAGAVLDAHGDGDVGEAGGSVFQDASFKGDHFRSAHGGIRRDFDGTLLQGNALDGIGRPIGLGILEDGRTDAGHGKFVGGNRTVSREGVGRIGVYHHEDGGNSFAVYVDGPVGFSDGGAAEVNDLACVGAGRIPGNGNPVGGRRIPCGAGDTIPYPGFVRIDEGDEGEGRHAAGRGGVQLEGVDVGNVVPVHDGAVVRVGVAGEDLLRRQAALGGIGGEGVIARGELREVGAGNVDGEVPGRGRRRQRAGDGQRGRGRGRNQAVQSQRAAESQVARHGGPGAPAQRHRAADDQVVARGEGVIGGEGEVVDAQGPGQGRGFHAGGGCSGHVDGEVADGRRVAARQGTACEEDFVGEGFSVDVQGAGARHVNVAVPQGRVRPGAQRAARDRDGAGKGGISGVSARNGHIASRDGEGAIAGQIGGIHVALEGQRSSGTNKQFAVEVGVVARQGQFAVLCDFDRSASSVVAGECVPVQIPRFLDRVENECGVFRNGDTGGIQRCIGIAQNQSAFMNLNRFVDGVLPGNVHRAGSLLDQGTGDSFLTGHNEITGNKQVIGGGAICNLEDVVILAKRDLRRNDGFLVGCQGFQSRRRTVEVDTGTVNAGNCPTLQGDGKVFQCLVV